MKRLFAIILLVITMLTFSFSSFGFVADTNENTYLSYVNSIQPINALNVSTLTYSYSSPTLNLVPQINGVQGSGDTLTSNQRCQLSRILETSGEFIGLFETLTIYPTSYRAVFGNLVCGYYHNDEYFDSRIFTYLSHMSNFDKVTKPLIRGSCTFFFPTDTSRVEAITIDFDNVDVTLEKLGYGAFPKLNYDLYSYAYNSISGNYAYRLHSPQYYAKQYAINNGLNEDIFDKCIAYALNDVTIEHTFGDVGANYLFCGTICTTSAFSSVFDTELAVIRALNIGSVDELDVSHIDNDTWLERIGEALDSFYILNVSYLDWLYIIFGMTILRYIVKLLLGG